MDGMTQFVWNATTVLSNEKFCTNNSSSFVNIFNYLTFNFIFVSAAVLVFVGSLLTFSLRFSPNNVMNMRPSSSYISLFTDNFSCLSHFFFSSSLFLGNAASQVLQHKEEPRFISQSEAFKFAVGDTIILPCEVTQPGECTHKFYFFYFIFYVYLFCILFAVC